MKKLRFFLPKRLTGRNGRYEIIVGKGVIPTFWRDPYYLLLTLSWFWFFVLTTVSYLATNALFALLYLAGGDCIENARSGSFFDAFFFSVQTMASIGYGAMYPRTDHANAIVTIEALAGLMGLAMATGLLFARFSRPTARVIFSRVAVITPYNGIPTLMFRTANRRHNLIAEAQIQASIVRDEITTEGHKMFRFHDLALVRNRNPVFSLTWTVMHQIDESSPLYGMASEDLVREETRITISLTGLDQTVSQPIHARHNYLAQDILENRRFVDILLRSPKGERYIDYNRFHDVTE